MKTMRFLSMVALALVGAVMTGCSSDDNSISEPQEPETKSNVVTLTTTVSLDGDAAGTRALTDEGVKTFAVGETMAIYYWKNKGNDREKAVSAPLTAGDIINGGKSATFTFTLDNPYKDQSVVYIYPAAMANADFTPNYDALYNNQDGTLETLASNFDFCTKSGAWAGDNLPSLTLENQLAILAITLKDEAGANDITSSITGMTVSDGTNSYTVSRSATAGPIYVAIRPTSSAAIEVTATDVSKNYTKSLTDKTYAAGNGYSVSWRMTEAVPAGAIDGKFSVSPTKKVCFSKGNLQATYNGSSWTWAFAENQWDYIGNAAGNTSINGNGTVSASNVTVDLFGWVGASNTTWSDDLGTTGNAAMHGISNSTAINDTNGYGINPSEALKSDWGITISDDYTWFTLTSDEWQWMLGPSSTPNPGTNCRASSTIGGVANARWVKAFVHSTNGLIIYPDALTWNEATMGTAPTTSNAADNDFTYNTLTDDQWSALEAAGCVFLPAAGVRSEASVINAGSRGYYWSSSAHASIADMAYSVNFSSSSLFPVSFGNRGYGYSVRLVREVE